MTRGRAAGAWGLLAATLVLLALARGVDHDESQYVAAVVLSGHGLLPFRDYAYLQMPLQPLLLAPVAAAAGVWTWPVLRIVNALLGSVAVAGVFAAARVAGAAPRPALLAAGLFASCDILLFAAGTARNDALPAALLAMALPLVVRGEQGRATRRGAALAGLLLAAAAASKVSYALPAAAYGVVALLRPRHRPAAVLAGALLPIGLVVATVLAAPDAFLFDVFGFPTRAPVEFYADRPWRLSLVARAIDAAKFLALGPALPVSVLVAVSVRWRRGAVLDLLVVAGLVAALLPAPTWRQYLLPMLPPLFVRAALVWQARPPGRGQRALLAVFAVAGLGPSLAGMARGPRPAMVDAVAEGRAIGGVLDRAGVAGPVATLSPQLLPAARRLPDPAFATGPFYFRSRHLLDAVAERRFHLVSRGRPAAWHPRPNAILLGGEAAWSAGDPWLDAELASVAGAGWRAVPVAGTRFRLLVRQRPAPPATPGNGR